MAQPRSSRLPSSAGVRAAVYARYSSDQQRDASIDDQVRLCRERIAREGWTLVEVFADRADHRVGYQAMLQGIRDGAVDVVVTEALDRLSRDQEGSAGLFKRLQFARVGLVTLAEGEVSELHVGLMGAMNALFLRDLADKTRRGLRGRVEAGRSGGGNAYGYGVVRQLGPDGEPVHGGRKIVEAEAIVVRRIHQNYADGLSPKAIAVRLNDEKVPAPRGGAWSASTINGNRRRGTGILNNELYVGRLLWNRLSYKKDPDTDKRLSRPNDATEIVVTQVPDLRIVDDALWARVRERQGRLDAYAQVVGKRRGKGTLLALNENGQLAWDVIIGGRLKDFEYDGTGVVIKWNVAGPDSRVFIDPRVSFGAPVVEGIPTWIISGRKKVGETVAEIANDFCIDVERVLSALQFEEVPFDEPSKISWIN